MCVCVRAWICVRVCVVASTDDWFPDIVFQPIPVEYLEPYSSEGALCHTYTNCLACLTDLSCGWCPTDSTTTTTSTSTSTISFQSSLSPPSPCKPRQDSASSSASSSSVCGDRELVLVAGQCSVCSDHVYCGECAADALCEWLPADARCTRRGRYSDAVRSTQHCPVPCEQ